MQILRLDEINNGRRDPAMKEYYIGPSFMGAPPREESLALFRRVLRNTESEMVFDWWLSLCKDGHPPQKSDLLLRDMARFAQNIGLVICYPDGTNQIRLAGSAVEEMIGRSLTGLDIKAVTPQSRGLCELSWRTQIIERRLRYYRRDMRHIDKEYRQVGILEMPVTDNENDDFKYVLSHIIQVN